MTNDPDAPAEFRPEVLRVLVADDSTYVRGVVRRVLREIGVRTVVEADNGAAAFACLRAEPIDAVITDWGMAPIDGLTLLQRIRRSPDSPNRRLPVILMSEEADLAHVSRARDAGTTEFLVKPLSPAGLADHLANMIRHPRPFVDTEGYVGPDRRRHRPHPHDPERRG